ncbi:hypothetical protein K2P97_04595 [bacterium]|nr:hypothetical protein [bacterium]
MLINCPRCGFSQPKDQYCAQCGVDMQAFKPKELPPLTRFFGNAGVQIALLLLTAALVGQYIIRSEEPQRWVQKMSPFQGVSKSEKNKNSASEDSEDVANSPATSAEIQENASSSQAQQLESLKNKEFSSARVSDTAGVTASSATSATVGSASSMGSGAQDLSSVNFKLIYAEVSQEMLRKWISDSSALGLYQSLTDYSAGILYDFNKRRETFQQNLKTSDIKLNLGATNSILSGTMTDDGSQVIGLITAIEYRASEADGIHGNIMVTRNSSQGSESYPAEFDLPKGAAFFIVGALKRENFTAERARLNMPPFQVFKSPDFMTRKTEFVIILEPDYK